MTSLHIKMWRELWHMRGQALAIMLVIVGGVGVCIMSLSTYDSLLTTRDNYYRDYGFGDVFSSLKRAPESLLPRLLELPGVAAVETRIVAQVNLQLPDFNDPVSGLLTSIPDHGQPRINRLHLVSGRLPDSRRDNEVLVSDAFAEAHALQAGDSFVGIINGRRRGLQVVGIALSPDYIYQIAPGALVPDYQRFGVLWMARKPLAAAYDMDGAFNDLAISLQRNASAEDVIDRVDLLLDRYGGLGAYDRDDQFSNQFLQEEFSQLKTMAYLFPVIFLGVAVFLLNVVVSRLVATQREIIAILKAFGYSNLYIAWHFGQLVLVITGLGIIGGYGLGIYLGQLMTQTYADYYRFPELLYLTRPVLFIGVGILTALASLAGTLRAVRQAASLPPAEAMRPEPPARYHKSVWDQSAIKSYLSQPDRMILRHLQRKPLKTLLSLFGLSMASAIMMVGNFQEDAVDLMMHVQFTLEQKQDIEVNFYEPVAASTLSTLRAINGVEYVEGLRTVPVKLHYQHRNFRTYVKGIGDSAHLQRLLNSELDDIALPTQGLMVTEHLATKLGFSSGDIVELETLDGKRLHRTVTVASLSQQFFGLGTYMRLDNLNRLLAEGTVINTALLRVDQSQAAFVYQQLREMPMVAGINIRQAVIDSFRDTVQQILLVFTFINALLGAVIAFGVVYNTARIGLAERGRELVSMRVLGYTQAEVAYILIGELALLTLLSIPIGFVIGAGLCEVMTRSLQSDLFRVPLVLSPYTYSFSALVVILSATVSGALVWHRLQQLDLVEVLKTRE